MFVFRLLLAGAVLLLPLPSHAAKETSPAATKDKSAPSSDAVPSFSWVHVNGPYVAMTFDDGPSAKLTPSLLDLLPAHHIKATFFLIGQNVAETPEIVARASREGHEL